MRTKYRGSHIGNVKTPYEEEKAQRMIQGMHLCDKCPESFE